MQLKFVNKVAVITILIFLLPACSSSSCDTDSKEVAFVKSLSNLQLTKIFTDTKEFFLTNERMHFGGKIPAQFTEIGVKAIRVHRGIHLRLQGCMDHYVDLVVFEQEQNQRIELWYGGNGKKYHKDIIWENK